MLLHTRTDLYTNALYTLLESALGSRKLVSVSVEEWGVERETVFEHWPPARDNTTQNNNMPTQSLRCKW